MSIFDRAFDRAARFIDDVLLLPDDVKERVERADAALDAGRVQEAEALFRSALEARPGLLRAQVGWARALEASGDVEGARIALAEARREEPDDPRLALLAGRLALRAGDVAAADRLAREAARRLASEGGAAFAQACVLRAAAEASRGRPDRAARELRKAIAAEPDEAEHKIALVEAFTDAGEHAAARRAARGLAGVALGDSDAARLGLALHRAGDLKTALPLLERAAALGRVAALEALAREAIARGDLAAAEERTRTAVARGGGPSALASLAGVLALRGRAGEAAEALLVAGAGGDVEMLRRAAQVVPLDDAAAMERVADALHAVSPDDAAAVVLRAHVLLARDQPEAASVVIAGLPSGAFSPGSRAQLAQARLAVAESKHVEALALLDELAGELPRGTHPDSELALSLRGEALRRLWRGAGGEVDLAAAIDGVLAFAKERGLGDAERRARALRDELDRPLLLAILGEFNAGKSTLVNAFVGADVAPTGILPTTATLNLLRGGAERRVRVVRRDGTTREGDWDDLRRLLSEAESEAGAAVDHVEIVLPSELLERVWILDTPGSNAPDPEHEVLAREAMRRADAALWVFDAGQAGKASEGRVLARVRESRRTVVAALNKVDRLREGQLEEIKAALARDMPEVGPNPVSLSAKKALTAKMADDDAAYVQSGFPALLERLETEIFQRSRQLKRRACAGRLIELLADTLGSEDDAGSDLAGEADALERAAEGIGPAAASLPSDVDAAIDALEAGQASAFEDAAREVLAFVRPRTHRFATHGTDPEDRAFLVETIDARFEAAVETSARGLELAVAERLRPALAGTALEASSRLRISAAVRPAMAAFAGLQEGLLRGGALRHFFDVVLPTATLSVEPIAEALGAARAHPRESLRPILEQSLTRLAAGLEADARRGADDARRQRERLLASTYEPLRALHSVLEELVG